MQRREIVSRIGVPAATVLTDGGSTIGYEVIVVRPDTEPKACRR